jgi:Icc-related predicted phosphoesterase
MKLFRQEKPKRAFRLFFATDIHGSDRCFRKFLAAARVYEAQALVLGGDIVGKAIVPIIRLEKGTYSCTFQGSRRVVAEDQLDALLARVRFNGLYPHVSDPDEAAHIARYAHCRDGLFRTLISRQLSEWLALAGERLDTHVRCIITPGNDDPMYLDELLARDERVESPEGQVVQVGPVWLASLGDTNRTPWATEREYDETELARRISTMIDRVADGRPLVFNFHCPPYDSGLDTVMALDERLQPVVRDGVAVEIPAGSVAVTDAINRYQPRVAFHGHIHESAGVCTLGSTVAINPGSDYSSGTLKGAIVDFDADGNHLSHLLTAG